MSCRCGHRSFEEPRNSGLDSRQTNISSYCLLLYVAELGTVDGRRRVGLVMLGNMLRNMLRVLWVHGRMVNLVRMWLHSMRRRLSHCHRLVHWDALKSWGSGRLLRSRVWVGIRNVNRLYSCHVRDASPVESGLDGEETYTLLK
jgi:hypothetical protein